MTRCYECLKQGVVGINMSIYEFGLPLKVIPLPAHDKCAGQIGLKKVFP
jgi:hypothetical protein